MDEQTALALVDPAALPVPTFSGPQMAQALVAYRELQSALDRAMPDQIMGIEGKEFRKKGYWRAVRVAFTLNVEAVDERREVFGVFADGQENFGWLVTYRATAPNGRTVTGDGACTAVEKAPRFKCPHPHPSWKGKTEHWPHEACPDFDPEFRWRALPAQASEHNIRSHAHTRAFNRAVSNLVGFGEVSAEEVERDEAEPPPGDAPPHPAATLTSELPPPRSAPRPASTSNTTAARITEPQGKRLWAIAKGAGWNDAEVHAHLQRYGFAHVDEITRDKYDRIIGELQVGVDGNR